MPEEPRSLQELLDRIMEAADDRDQVSLGEIMEAVGSRSFGPLLLLAGVITVSPLSGIPGVPTMMSVLVLLLAIQLLLPRKHFWLPQWLLRRSLPRDKLEKAMKWVRPPARLIDRLLRRRLTIFTNRAGMYAIAIICIVIAAAMPAMEVVPFTATGAGAALTAFGLSLIARDGSLALLAYLITVGILGVVLYNLL